MRLFWVSADGLETEARIDSLVALAAEAGANGLVVQVMGRGEAWYESELLPEATVVEDFDPLARVILRAGPLGMEVHAWVNAFLTWSAPWEPESPEHVYHAHPGWFMADLRGRSTRDYSREECEQAGLVGATLSPAIPGVRERLASICAEIASEYDVEGIHLDYIRYPGRGFGFEEPARAAFILATGADPVDIRASGSRGAAAGCMEDAWTSWRADQVTETVETVRARLRSEAPEVSLSCAVMADPGDAYEEWGCDWPSWLEDGLVDFVCPMVYTTDPSRAAGMAAEVTAAEPSRVVWGMAVYNQPLRTALVGAAEALADGAGGICVYSLNTFSAADAGELRAFWGSGTSSRQPGAAIFHRLVPF